MEITAKVTKLYVYTETEYTNERFTRYTLEDADGLEVMTMDVPAEEAEGGVGSTVRFYDVRAVGSMREPEKPDWWCAATCKQVPEPGSCASEPTLQVVAMVRKLMRQ